MMRRGPPEERSAMGPFSEPESALARSLGNGAHAPVVEEAVAVEHDPVDPLLEATPRGEEPHLLGGAHVPRLLELRAQLGRERRDREQRLARAVRDHLHVGVLVAAEDGEPGPLLGATHPLAHPRPAASTRDGGRTGPHQRVPAAVAAALPALRRMRSSAYLTPFALYGSGGRSSRSAAAAWPSSSRSAPSSVIITWRSTLAESPGGSRKWIGWE